MPESPLRFDSGHRLPSSRHHDLVMPLDLKLLRTASVKSAYRKDKVLPQSRPPHRTGGVATDYNQVGAVTGPVRRISAGRVGRYPWVGTQAFAEPRGRSGLVSGISCRGTDLESSGTRNISQLGRSSRSTTYKWQSRLDRASRPSPPCVPRSSLSSRCAAKWRIRLICAPGRKSTTHESRTVTDVTKRFFLQYRFPAQSR
jgi:hypothetical protein